jgi:hypothetical protein
MSKSWGRDAIGENRCATSVDRSLQQGYADWFKQFSWSWYITLTFDRDVGSMQASDLVERYLRELEVRSADMLTCLIVKETKHYSGLGMPAGRVHFHMLVATAAPALTAEVFRSAWERKCYGGRGTNGPSAEVRLYDQAISATYYLMKTLHEFPDNWELRRGGFRSPVRPASWHRSARARRTIRRQQARDHSEP